MVYDLLVALHVICAVIGFGSLAVNGAYGVIARRPEREGASDETARFFTRPGWADLLILAVPVFGLAALAARPRVGDLADLWVIAGLAIWLIAAAILVAVERPAAAGVRRALESGSSPAPAATRLAWSGTACDVLFVAALAVMVTRPA